MVIFKKIMIFFQNFEKIRKCKKKILFRHQKHLKAMKKSIIQIMHFFQENKKKN